MKTPQYINIIKYLYYILFFVLPFVVLPINSELFEFNKMLFIYTIATLIGGVWLSRCFQERKIILKKTTFDIPLILFFVSQSVSALFSIDQHTSFFGYYGRFNGGLLSIFTYLFLYYGFVSNIEEDINKTVRTIFHISILSSILVVLWGLPGTFNHDLSCLLFTNKFDNTCWTAQFRPSERMFSTLGQPNWMGAYLAITFFMSIYILFTSSRSKSRIFGGVGIVFCYIGILLSRSRSSMGSLVPGVILLCLYFIFQFSKKNDWFTSLRKKIILIGIIILLLITVLVKTGISQIDYYLSFSFLKSQTIPIVSDSKADAKPLEVVGGITDSFDIRKIVWQGALTLGEQYPLFGTGVETFGYAYYLVRPQAHNLTSEWDYLYNKAHNEYLNLYATTGLFGLVSFIVLILWMGVVLVKKLFSYRKESDTFLYYLTLSCIFSSIFITNFFGFSITVINVYWYMTLGFLVLFNTPNIQKMQIQSKISPSQLGIVLIAGVWIINLIGSYWMADYYYAQSDIAIKNSNTEAAVNLLQKAMALREEHVYEDKLSYALAQYAYLVTERKDKNRAKEAIDLAEKLNLKSIKSSPQNVLYWKTRVKNQFIFYQMTLNKEYLFTGLAALDEAAKLAPTDPKIPYFSSTYYSLLYDDEKNTMQKELYKNKSTSEIEKAISLKSNYGDAYYLKIQLLKKYGKRDEARKLFEWYIPRYAPGNEQMQKELEEI